MISNNTSKAYNYTTIRYLIDPDRNIDAPVGVVLCNTDTGDLFFRLPKPEERIPHVPASTAKASLELAQSKIQHWLRTGEVPYAKEPLKPLSEAWWEQVRKLMQFRVRIGPVQAIDCQRPEEEIETLYEAVVKPHVPKQARAERVDGAVTRVLGEALASCLLYKKSVPGFQDRPINVLRCVADAHRVVIVEAVNLAASTAEEETYALMSKLRSIKANFQRSEFIVGYLASPEGLNGEASLKNWFEQDVGVPMHDLTHAPADFRNSVQQAIAGIGDELGIIQHTGSLSASSYAFGNTGRIAGGSANVSGVQTVGNTNKQG